MHNKYENMSKQELIKKLEETEHQLSYTDYFYEYEDGYWINFVVDLIVDGKIDVDYWAERMPEVNPYPHLINAFAKRMNSKHLSLTDEEFAKAQELRKEKPNTLSIVEHLRTKQRTNIN